MAVTRTCPAEVRGLGQGRAVWLRALCQAGAFPGAWNSAPAQGRLGDTGLDVQEVLRGH